MITKDEIQKQYTALATKVGDLYFVISHKEAELAECRKLMAQYHDERQGLQKALSALQEDVPTEVPGNAVEATNTAS